MSSFFRRTVTLALVVASFGGIPTLARSQPFQPWDCTSFYWPFAGPVQWVSYPPVVYYEPCDVIPAPLPCSVEERVPSQQPLATPSPAPPSPTGPAAPTKPAPKISESRSYYDAALGVDDRVVVGFWNLSNQEKSLIVDNRRHVLVPGQSARLDVGRRFTWRIENGDLQSERVPDGVPTMEIVIRQ
jgi:hypothetical protein